MRLAGAPLRTLHVLDMATSQPCGYINHSWMTLKASKFAYCLRNPTLEITQLIYYL